MLFTAEMSDPDAQNTYSAIVNTVSRMFSKLKTLAHFQTDGTVTRLETSGSYISSASKM